MIKLSIYDFDKTLYRHDTGIQVLFSLFRWKPILLLYIPKILFFIMLRIFKIIPVKLLKEQFFSPINFLSKEEWNTFITMFWNKEKSNVFPNVADALKKDKENGYTIGIISASPEIFLYPVMDILPADFLIGTILDTSEKINSRIIGNNCKNQEKVSRLYDFMEKYYPNTSYQIKKTTSDSLNDLPLYKISQECFTVEKNGSIYKGLPKPNYNI